MGKKEEKSNLKGRTDILRYYRLQKTGQFEPIKRKVADKQSGKKIDQEYEKEIEERVYFSEDQVREFSLDRKGMKPVPDTEGHKTIFNNYFFDFWGHFLGAEATILYGHLLRHCYGEKDFCWPNLKLIAAKMGKSEKTVRTYLDKLEEYGFVYRFLVENVSEKKQDSTLYKVRKTIPLLWRELIEKLPTELREDHDEYLKIVHESVEQSIPVSFDVQGYYEDVIQSGKKKEKVKQLTIEDIERVNKIKQSKVLRSLTEEDAMLWNRTMEYLTQRIMKNSMDMWINKLLAKRVGGILILYAVDNWILEHVQTRFKEDIEWAVRLVDENIEEIHFVLV